MADTTTTPRHWRKDDFESFGQWYAMRRRRSKGKLPAASTLRSKQTWLAKAANLIGAEREECIAEVTHDRKRLEFLLDRMALDLSSGALRNAIYALWDYSSYAQAMGWIASTAFVESDIPPRNPDPPITVYSEDEMDRFVTMARGAGLRWWSFLAFLAETGRRVGEALSLEWEWLRLDADIPYFELPATKTDPQYVPLTKLLREEVFTAEHIERLKAGEQLRSVCKRSPSTYIFPWTYSVVEAKFERFCRDTGLPDRGFHNFRHSVITHRLAKGVPLQAVAALAGHSNPGITARRYNHTNALSYARFLD